MGYLSCNAESAIAVCDPYNWDRRRKKKNHRSKKGHNTPIEIREFGYDELAAATCGFAADRFLGKGSHGSVYKAVLDGGRLHAAVKKTPASQSKFGYCENEIEVLSKVRNPRLVNLIGYCVDSRESKLLVVEYMPNGSFYELLHAGSGSRPPGWTKRVRHALQIARAVHALHTAEPPVIHRDIKSSNVLIDENGAARLGDFGLALRGHVEDDRVKCTPPAGTLGYLDPSYLKPTDLSTKSDVFSFGILLLEIISGRNAIDLNYSPPSVVDWAVPLIKRGDFVGIIDPRIDTPQDANAIRIMAVLAARCVRSTAEKRPDMAEVVECLKLVSRRSQAPPVWTNLRRRVRGVERSGGVFRYEETEEIAARSVRCGSRRQKKVSSVASVEEQEMTLAPTNRDRVMRSKSVGLIRFARVEPNPDDREGGEEALIGRREMEEPRVAVIAATPIRLSKSRSLVVRRSARILRYRESTETEIEISKLAISTLDENSHRNLQEKPLVYV